MQRKLVPQEQRVEFMKRAQEARLASNKLRASIKAASTVKWSWKIAVKYKCRECTNNQYTEIKQCNILTCSCWPGRLGTLCNAEEMRRWSEEYMKSPLNQEFVKTSKKEE
jgi:hypothetical protein